MCTFNEHLQMLTIGLASLGILRMQMTNTSVMADGFIVRGELIVLRVHSFVFTQSIFKTVLSDNATFFNETH